MRDDDLGPADALALGLPGELVIGADPRLRLGLPGAGRLANPLQLAGQGACARLVLARLVLEALGLLLQPGRIVALPGHPPAAVQFQDPAGDVVKKIAVVGDDQHRAGVFDQVLLQPGDGLGVEMVGGLVEQQHLGRLEQQPAERHPARLAAREGRHVRAVGRAAQRLHGDVDLGVEVPQTLGVDLVLEGGHLLHQRLGIVLGDLHGDLVEAGHQRRLGRNPLHHVAAHVPGRVELGLLRQVAHPDALGRPGLAGKIGVQPGHDPHQGRLARAVDADDADLDPGQEAQADVLEQLLAAAEGLRDPVHVIDVLIGCHAARLPLAEGGWSGCGVL